MTARRPRRRSRPSPRPRTRVDGLDDVGRTGHPRAERPWQRRCRGSCV